MTDTPKQITTKINKYAFSGGQASIEEHRRLGGDTEVDVPYNYLRHFMDDDERLEQLGQDYRTGKLLTGELKKICIEVLQEFVADFQSNKSKVTDEVVKNFMDSTRKIDPGVSQQNTQSS